MKFTVGGYEGPRRYYEGRIHQGDQLTIDNENLVEPIQIKGDGRFEDSFKAVTPEPYLDLGDPRIAKMIRAAEAAAGAEDPEKAITESANQILGGEWDLYHCDYDPESRSSGIALETNSLGWGGNLNLGFGRAEGQLNFDRLYVTSSNTIEESQDSQLLKGTWSAETQSVEPNFEEVKFRVQKHKPAK